MWVCFMVIHLDPTQITFFFNGAVRGGIPVRMLEITSQIVNAFDVNVILRKALFANVLRKRRTRRKIRRWPDVHT